MTSRHLYLFLALCSLSSCALIHHQPMTPSTASPVTLPVTPNTPSETFFKSDALRVALRNFEQDRSLGVEGRNAQIAALEQAAHPDSPSLVRLALLLSMQHDPKADARALDVLHQVARQHDGDAEALAPLVTLISDALSERTALQMQQEQLNEQLQEAEARSASLASKIQELKDIENRLVSRPGPETPPARAAPHP